MENNNQITIINYGANRINYGADLTAYKMIIIEKYY